MKHVFDIADYPSFAAADNIRIKNAASSLLEAGLAFRNNDRHMAKIYLGVAGNLFERAADSQNAEIARNLAAQT